MTLRTIITITLVIAGIAVIFYVGYSLIFKHYRRSNTIERTLAIIKPEAVQAHQTGPIIDRIEQMGFTIIDFRKVHLGKEEAAKFYHEHKNKSFFGDMTQYISSGPIVVMILEKLNAIGDWRDLMGATNPAKAKDGTIRKQFGTNIEKNAVHGSDSQAAAQQEIAFFFADRRK